ncbi:MAG: hypothetical protein GY909_12260 [Oligoflexia bacterium]|nr:hypothetical protein [Oligoflexia bacterium]
MNKDSSYSSLIMKYEDQLEADPKSRVFAPLAEAYRKVGLLDKALEVLKTGIRYNPDYTTGFLTLASCYRDMGQMQLAYSTLRPLSALNKDNYRFQKLFGDVCLELNHLEEALDTFKYILFLNPKDTDAASIVEKLESELEEPTVKVEKIVFDVEDIKTSPKDEDDLIEQWVRVDLGESEAELEQVDQWTVEKNISDNKIKTEVQSKNTEAVEEVEVREEVAPIITHTLVDLYLNQGYIDKAIEVLEKIVSINPNDKRSQLKLSELKNDNSDAFESVEYEENLDEDSSENLSEDSGRANLMDLYDKTVAEGEFQIDESSAIDALSKFGELIKNRALELKNTN